MELSVSQEKLHPPELPPGYISRPRLLKKLEKGQEKNLTLVIAGAGYGKSAMLAEWVQSKTTCVWYSLDAPDRDPGIFFAYLLAGLQQKWPGLGKDVRAMLNRPTPPDPERLMIALLGGIETIVTGQGGERPLLVFDDYHRLGNASNITAAMKLLLERLPPTIHVVISSRSPLNFTVRLGLDGQINKLTNQDLRLKNDEVRQILGDLNANTSAIQKILRQTEGWVAGVQLLRQALQSTHSLGLQMSPGATNDSLADVYAYLAEETFTQHSPELQQFLLQTAILDTFSPEDCDAIFKRSDSAHWIAYLTHQNLFIIHLQRNPDIYRYHHLLTDYLRQKLKREKGADEIRGWHRRAAIYYQQYQQWAEAFDQAQKARDESLAIQVIAQASRPMLLAGRLNTVEDWFNRFTPETYANFPRLYTLRGDIWFEQGNYEQALGAYQRVIALSETNDDQQSLLHAWHGIGAISQRTGDHERADSAFSKALEYVDETNTLSHLKVLIGLANSYKTVHQNQKAAKAYRKCLKLAFDTDNSVQAIIMHNLGITLQDMGEFSDALHWLQRALLLRRKIGYPSNTASSLNSIGLIQCMLGDFESARRNLEEALDLCKDADSPVWYAYISHSRGDLALTEQDFSLSEQYYRKSIAIKETLHDVAGLAITWGMMGDLYRCRGNLVEAASFVHRALQPGIKSIGLNNFLIVQTILAKIWLEQGKLSQAADILEEVVQKHETATNNKFELVKSLWHQARTQYSLKQPTHETLAKVLMLTQHWNYHFLLYILAYEYPDLLAEAVTVNLQSTLVTDLFNELGETAVPSLVRLLESPKTEVRIRAIQQLASIDTDSVWEPLVKIVRRKSVSGAVKQEAKKALEILKNTPPAPLFVTTLGEFTLHRGDKLIPDSAWGSRKAQILFKYLLEHTGNQVQREELLNIFWPKTLDDSQARKKAHKNLNQLVSWIRQALEPYLPSHYPSRYLTVEKQMYRLDLPDGSSVDGQLFEDVMTKAENARRVGNIDAMLAYYQEGAALYRGDYLAEIRFEDWCIMRREQLRLLAIRCFYELASAYLAQDELETAVSYTKRLLQMEPWHEEGCSVLIRCLIKLGRTAEARRVCRECKKQLKEELDITRSVILDDLCRQIS